mmetsp:Transcript_26884/g.47801  ORF Transcript_26884/g.47801 Transcript_26884/m.47801 type:complete len:302 (+) Transcript_26884:168-1073(+)
MQDLCTKVCEFAGFFETDLIQCHGMRDDPWIGTENAIDVLPNLNFVQSECGSQCGGRQIGSTPSQCGNFSVWIVSNKSSDDGDDVWVDALIECLLDGGFVFGQQFGIAKVGIGLNANIPSIKGECRDTELVETCRHDSDAATFSVTDELIERFGREFLNHPYAREHLFAFLQEFVYVLTGVILFVEFEFVHGVYVERTNGVDADASLQGELSRTQQVVGSLPHGRTDDGSRTISLFDLILNQVGDMIDAFGICQRTATKFEDAIDEFSWSFTVGILVLWRAAAGAAAAAGASDLLVVDFFG